MTEKRASTQRERSFAKSMFSLPEKGPDKQPLENQIIPMSKNS
jgi:hypothetical protein